MSLKGDFGALAAIGQRLGLASRLARDQVARDLGRAAVGLVAKGFASGTSPDGKAWKPLKRPTGRRPLQGRGVLSSSFRASIEGNRIRVESSVPYMAAHQYGVPSRNLPARPMVPRAGELPARWVTGLAFAGGVALGRVVRSLF